MLITLKENQFVTTLKIIRIPILPFRMVNCFLILGAEGCVLVDTGLPGSESKIGNVLEKNGLSFKDIKLIVITHAHVDHAGSAARMRELSGAPIVAHEGDPQALHTQSTNDILLDRMVLSFVQGNGTDIPTLHSVQS